MKYRVHSHHRTTVPVTAQMKDGTPVQGELPTSIVELVPEDGAGPSLTIHRPRRNADEAKAADDLFAEGNTVQLGFTAAAATQKESNQ